MFARMSHLDLTFLHQNVTDDPAFILQILEVFVSGLDEDLPALRNAIASSDHAEIRAKTHKVKSGFRSLGMTSITQQLQEIENMAKDQAPISEIRTSFEAFDLVLPEALKEIEEYRSNN